eukprot:CAMPEP_0119299146 /NCGR_PEP_ID=MMETSP1333-20130426/1253_1 /TAXON_ID=418940 /ORGANISM="Scyphosphaera apsteinii, Strain RCC1455" /LENGTH=50 /DNA_ID=CAMNT_0007300475 /DNA_START=520 /DNA_END=672 /DNA_ORIENTATION=+
MRSAAKNPVRMTTGAKASAIFATSADASSSGSFPLGATGLKMKPDETDLS